MSLWVEEVSGHVGVSVGTVIVPKGPTSTTLGVWSPNLPLPTVVPFHTQLGSLSYPGRRGTIPVSDTVFVGREWRVPGGVTHLYLASHYLQT